MQLQKIDDRYHITGCFITWVDEVAGGKGNLDRIVKKDYTDFWEGGDFTNYYPD
jgi:hypothetical protein